MHAIDYHHLALRTKSLETTITTVALGLAGEAGECADLVKKAQAHGHVLDRKKFLDELGDLLWYIAVGCDLLNTDIGAVMEANIEKLRLRYPEGFDSRRSKERYDDA